ncbi:MAG: tRNA uridine-5-carboxymethylaminomethyl(34) synthesis GTPase MnmE [Paracoccaceae bacterium]
MTADTIFAPATARGRAAIAVLRISGPRTEAALDALGASRLAPRRASLRVLHDPRSGEALDEVLALRFEAGASFTGEASAELHLHGGTAVMAAVLDALSSMPGLRLAEPGEFARRAVEGGRLGLIEAEAIADLVDAETEAQRRLALRAKRGALGDAAEGWRRDLVRARALVEAVLDFADEEVPEDVTPEVSALLAGVASSIAGILAGAGAAERLREGFEVAVLGAPNAGKSSLLNVLARRDVAITSAVAGTTRDVIEVRMDLFGLPVTMLDTAGIRETEDPVEAEGVARARARGEAADLRLWLMAPGGEPPPDGLMGPDDLVLASKADLAPGPDGSVAVSVVSGMGIETIIDAVASVLERRAAGASAAMRVRHRVALEAASNRIAAAEGWLPSGDAALDLVAEELRAATTALAALLGRVDPEDVLDDIFASFCLGK